MGAVFVSYRRGDSEGQARALFNELAGLIGKDSVFMDVDSIALGRDFRQILQERLGSCDLMLALIGPDWLDVRDPSGNRRLESAADFVRQEIAAALKRNIPVTPVLVRGAQMPDPERLPDDLKDLAYRNGFELSHTRWESDVREMITRLGLAKADGQELRQPATVTGAADRPLVTRSSGSVVAARPLSSKMIAIGAGATLLVTGSLVLLLMSSGDPTLPDQSLSPNEPIVETAPNANPANGNSSVPSGSRPLETAVPVEAPRRPTAVEVAPTPNADAKRPASPSGGSAAPAGPPAETSVGRDEPPAGFMMLINAQTGKCLTIAGGRSTDNNVPALQFDCDGDPSRTWRITATGVGVYQISNAQTGKCLTIAGGRSTDNNVPALQFNCDGDPSRTWRITATGGVYQISNVQTGKCLTIAGGRSTDNNVPALQFDCDSDLSRTWRISPAGQKID